MAGRIQFDREKVVADSLLLFWRKGFIATSMEDIKAATGINESSLYNTFGSKKELFTEALHSYAKRVKENITALPAEDRPAESIRILLRQVASQATQRDMAVGCMLMNSALELGPDHQDIVDFVRNQYMDIEEWMHDTIVRAQSKGEILCDKSPRTLARFLIYSVQSMFTMARTNPTEEFMNDVVETTLSILRPTDA